MRWQHDGSSYLDLVNNDGEPLGAWVMPIQDKWVTQRVYSAEDQDLPIVYYDSLEEAQAVAIVLLRMGG